MRCLIDIDATMLTQPSLAPEILAELLDIWRDNEK